ncbi:MAG: hypothetical protein PHP50_13860 [Lachnospiraceae bacterium]|nr:hypothetical protein [Lachnospiraceae bacterium]
MQKEDERVYQQIQKNTEMAIKTISELEQQVEDRDFSRQLARESIKYSELYNRALSRLVDDKKESYHGNYLQDMVLKSFIRAGTMLNNSTSHMAELMIEGTNRGITDMCKVMNHISQTDSVSVELARELMDFEENTIEELKRYL